MSTPVPELITSVLVARLETIQEINGYNFDISEVVRPDRRGQDVRYKHLSVIIDTQQERNEEIDVPGNPPAIGQKLTFNLKCVIRDENEPQAKAINDYEMAAALQNAITSTGGDWYSFGGYAINTEWGNLEKFGLAEGEITGFNFPVIVSYRVSETNAFQVR